MRRRQWLGMAVVGILAAVGCSTLTSVSTVWQAPQIDPPAGQLMVLGVLQSEGARRAFEESVVQALAERGVRAQTSFVLMGVAGPYTKEAIQRVAAERGVDGALVARLAGVEQQTHVTTSGPPMAPYGGFYGYYDYAYANVQVHTSKAVKMETNVYRIASGDLLWAAESKTFDPTDTQDAILSYASAIAGAVVSAGVVAGEPAAPPPASAGW